MVWTTKKGKKVEYHGGGKERIHLQVTTSVLAELFKTTKRTKSFTKLFPEVDQD